MLKFFGNCTEILKEFFRNKLKVFFHNFSKILETIDSMVNRSAVIFMVSRFFSENGCDVGKDVLSHLTECK